ncbi:MAG: tetrahydrofolate dehydrogenase/cyclohydrolase catalytic domain-containing protein [Terracidiphilus sp.]|jgi:methylenetetrahydrofolate dehydrogenase (NADP+)/methenyltetrahydrofolate cyclohydrolase
MTVILDGNKIASDLLQVIKRQLDAIGAGFHSRPRLALISVATGNLMTETAVDLHKVCAGRAGCDVEDIVLSKDTSQSELCHTITGLNSREDITAIMVLQPLPDGIDVATVINAIAPEKEAEGLHPANLARMFPTSLRPFDFDTCVPQALKFLLSAYDLYVSGMHWVLLVQTELLESDIIAGTNVRAALVGAVPPNSTVTLIAPNHPDAKRVSQSADGILATSRETNWLDDSWIRPGAIVVDFLANMVGERPHPLDPDKKVPLLKGSVDAKAIKGKAGYFAPVLGGIGPMLIGSLFYNCMLIHARRLSAETLAASDVIAQLQPPSRIDTAKRQLNLMGRLLRTSAIRAFR